MANISSLYILKAPTGQLSGNGQLRETVQERRKREGDDVKFWYLSSNLLKDLNISTQEEEAVVSDKSTPVEWLQLRFGGDITRVEIDTDYLYENSMELPPAATFRDISI